MRYATGGPSNRERDRGKARAGEQERKRKRVLRSYEGSMGVLTRGLWVGHCGHCVVMAIRRAWVPGGGSASAGGVP